MIKFKEFLAEKYLQSNHAPLYHFTDLHNLENIVKTGKLSKKDFDSPTWSATRDTPLKPDHDTRVSLTRNKNLNFGNHGVRITLDGEDMRSRHKLHPYADRSMASKSDRDVPVSTKGESRSEAEEVSTRAIHLKKVKHKIEVRPHIMDELHKRIKHHSDDLEKAKALHKEISSPNFKWNPDRHAHHFGIDVEKNREHVKDKPNWVPGRMHERVAGRIQNNTEQIDNYKNILNHIHGVRDD